MVKEKTFSVLQLLLHFMYRDEKIKHVMSPHLFTVVKELVNIGRSDEFPRAIKSILRKCRASVRVSGHM